MKYPIAFRVLLGLSSLLVIATLFLPLWEIYLWAPQYPEGLSITIWHNNVKGDVDVINGLNHYIGMKHIKAEMFPEFKVLKYIIFAFIAFGLFVAINGTVKWLKIFCTLTLLGGLIALGDFYRWGYDYGHNLDPTAPIQVPGMAYQPPVIGYKDLLNFTALSTPAAGGWIIISVGVIAFAALFLEFLKKRKLNKTALLLLPILSVGLASCNSSTPKINFGSDDCNYCQMKLMDQKFGILIQTPKGKEFVFDDYHCYQSYLKEKQPEIANAFVVCFNEPGKLIEAKQSWFVKSEKVKSPMGSNIAFFSTQGAANESFPENERNGEFVNIPAE